MRSAEPLWRALEAMPVLSGVREAWRRVAGQDLPAIERFLRPMADLAGSYPCPDATDEECPRGVVVHGDDDIVAVCRRSPRACDTIALCRDDIVVLRLDLRLLARAVADVLGVNAEQPIAVDGLTRTFHVGSYGPDAASRANVYLTLQPGRAELLEVAERLAARTGSGFVLLTATTAGCTPDLAEFLRARGAYVLALTDLTALEDDARLVASPDTGRLLRDSLGAFRPGAEERYVFQRQGKTWRVAFEGRACSVDHSIGMEYIAELLRNPHRDIHSSKLFDVVAREASRARGSAGETLDSEAVQGYRKRLADLEGDLADAEERADVTGQERLLEERDLLLTELKNATGLGGRSRRAADQVTRARQAVSKAIHRAKKAIKRDHPTLADHLDGSLTIGLALVYRPDREVAWVT